MLYIHTYIYNIHVHILELYRYPYYISAEDLGALHM